MQHTNFPIARPFTNHLLLLGLPGTTLNHISSQSVDSVAMVSTNGHAFLLHLSPNYAEDKFLAKEGARKVLLCSS